MRSKFLWSNSVLGRAMKKFVELTADVRKIFLYNNAFDWSKSTSGGVRKLLIGRVRSREAEARL